MTTTFMQRYAAALGSLAFFTVGTLLLFHPLWRDGGQIAYGQFGDLTATMAYWREIVQEGLNPFRPGVLKDFNAPDGMPVLWTLTLASPLSSALIWLLTAVFGAVAAQSIYLLLGLVLNGWAAFMLVKWLTSDWRAGLISGVILAWYPWAIASGGWQPDFAHAWPFVLLLWRLLCIQEAPTVRNGVWGGLALVFAMAWTPYYILFGAVTLGAVAISILVVGQGAMKARVIALAITGGWMIAFVGVLVLIDRHSTASAARTYALSELYDYTTRLHQWVTPHQGLFAKLGGSIDSSLWANSSYVGITVLVLAAIGAVYAFRARDTAVGRAGIAALMMAVVAAFVASPPSMSVLGVSIPMPSRLVYEIAPTWRVLGRLVIVVEVGLAVLAGIGAMALLKRYSGRKSYALASALLLIVLVDLWPHPQIYARLEPPESVRMVAGLPAGVVANYPLQPEGQTNMDVRFYQQAMKHPVLNGYPSGSRNEAAALALADLTKPQTLDGLWLRGVRYILVSQPPSIALPASGLTERVVDKRYGLYEVEPRTVNAVALPTEGISPGEGWMESSTASFDVWSNCTCPLRVTILASSYGQARTLTIKQSGGSDRKLFTGDIPEGPPQTLELTVQGRAGKRQSFDIKASPEPQPIAGPDPRTVGIRVESLTVAKAD